MLKFFRQYNKWILAVGASFLMIAFLVDPSMWAGGGDDGGEPIGSANGREITINDHRQADAELTVLRHLGLPTLVDEGPEAWLLMKTEADMLGIKAGQLDVDTVLGLIGMDDRAVLQVASSVRANADFVRETIRSWAIIQSYRELILGLGHRTLQDRLGMYLTASNLYQQVSQAPEFLQQYYIQQAAVAVEAASGQPRVSEPMFQRMAMDQLAMVKFTALAIPSLKVLPSIGEPDPAKVAELFEKYKNTIPATREQAVGVPFGYRTPDRVKFEYLSLPLDRLRSKIVIDEAEAFEHYEANKDQYRAAAKPGEGDMLSGSRGDVQPYAQVRTRVIAELTDAKAAELGDRIIKAARAMLLEHASGLVEKDGYRDIPPDWQPMPLTAIAESIQKDPQFGVLMDAHHFGDRWFDAGDLSQQPNIGRAYSPAARPIPFPVYALSTREINPDSPLASMTRLQVGMPSAGLQGYDGTRYLFRLIAAEKARSPESLDEVRSQVVSDARRLAAFELLQTNQQEWLDQALASTDWKALAEKLGVELIESGDVARREFAGRGQPQPPMVDRIGRSAAVIDAVFEKAYALAQQPSIADAPLPNRIGAAASEPTLSLIIFRVEGFTPIPRSRYESEVSRPVFGVLVNEALKPVVEDTQDAAASDPLSLDAIKKRINFVSAQEQK